MSENEEAKQEASLDLYKSQLSQVDQAIQAAGATPDLTQLKSDLQELISLTEESLLNLKKARLLSSLGEPDSTGEVTEPSSSTVDDVYAAFQAALSTDLQSVPSQSSSPGSSLHSKPSCSGQSTSNFGTKSPDNAYEDEENDNSDDDDEDETPNNFLHLIGTKCRAPFSHDWGGHHYGNAMIWSVDPPTDSDGESDFKVRVIFLNPTHHSIIPCKYFMDGSCRFSDEQCRRSHGHPVPVTELIAYEEPDHSKICEGCRCLAKYTDDVWHPATVTDVCDDHLVNVQFDALKQECTVQVEHIVPLEEESDDENNDYSDSEEGPSGLQSSDNSRTKFDEDEDNEVELPVYLWKPAQTKEKMGAWETHTKGIGSKLMAKMGYITGQGLGPQGDGRAEPVPILLLPQGKSLDKIMELKEMAGDADLFNAMKKMERRQERMLRKAEDKEKNKEAKQNWGVFGFINNKLGEGSSKGSNRRGQPHFHQDKTVTEAPSTSKDLNKRSDKEVNIQIFKTAEEIRAVERDLGRLKQQLVRNESKDRKMTDNIKRKIAEQEKYLNQLKTSSQTLETHKDRRSAHKKLTIF